MDRGGELVSALVEVVYLDKGGALYCRECMACVGGVGGVMDGAHTDYHGIPCPIERVARALSAYCLERRRSERKAGS